MSLLLHLLEAAGMLVAASSVRMVAGTVAALVSLAGMTATRFFSGDSALLILPVALVIILLLRTNSKWIWIACSAFVVSLLAVTATWGHYSGDRLTPVQIVVALPSAMWLVLGLKEKNGAAVAMTGPPLAILLVDAMSARLLLIASAVALAGLLTKSYRLKRQLGSGW